MDITPVLRSTENAAVHGDTNADSPLRSALLHNRVVLVNNMRARSILCQLVTERVFKEATAEEVKKVGKGTNIEMNEAIIAELYGLGDVQILRLCLILRRNGQGFLADLIQDDVKSDVIHVWDPASKKLGNHWKRLALALKTETCIAKIIELYPDNVRAQALFWLIEWEKNDATNASPKKLAEALQSCGMKKAAAYVKKLSLTRSRTKRRKRSKSGTRRKGSPSRSPSARRSRSGKGQRYSAVASAGTPASGVQSGVGSSKRRKKGNKRRGKYWKADESEESNLEIQDDEFDDLTRKKVHFDEEFVKRSLGDMRIHVTVDTVEFSPIPRQSEEQVTASFLSKLLNDRETSAPTRYAVEGIHPGLSVDDVIKIRKDCATFVVSCRTLSAVDTLWERYQDCDRLLKLMQKTLVTDSLLKEVIAKDITIQIQMDEDEYHICREELLAAAAAGLNIPMSYGGPKKEVMEQLRKQSDKYKVQLNETITEYHKFEMNMTNFVSALKRIKPTSVQKLSSVFMVDKYFEICSSKTSNMKRALELFRQNINNMAHLHDNVRDNVLANMSKIRPEVETDLQTKCRLKVEAHLSEWERMLDPHCDIAQIAIHQSAKECTPTPDLLALRPVLSLIPTLLEMAGKVDRRVSTYIQDDDNNNV